MELIKSNRRLMAEIDHIAEVAGYLWTKGWAERNGGNISVNLTDYMGDTEKGLLPLGAVQPLQEPVEALAGQLFYVTGTGKRMRYVAQDPWANGAIIRITKEGGGYEIIADQPIAPTSELPSHLMMHDYLRRMGRNNRVVLHTHPTDLIAMTHCKKFQDADVLTRTLWSMIPECRMVVPHGVGIVPYEAPGTTELAHATLQQLARHRVICWSKHGVLAVGEDVVECFDAIDTLSKSAQIYFYARMAGEEPEGLTNEQIDQLRPIV